MIILHPRQFHALRNEAVLAVEIGERAYLSLPHTSYLWWIVEPDQWVRKYWT